MAIVRTFIIALAAMSFLAGCETVPVKKGMDIVTAGEMFGLNLRDQAFAKLDTCHDDPLRGISNDPAKAICYSTNSGNVISLYWAKANLTELQFVKVNTESIAFYSLKLAREAAVVVPDLDAGSARYFNIQIGDSWKSYQGVVFLKTKTSEALGVVAVLGVRGKSKDAVKKEMEFLLGRIK